MAALIDASTGMNGLDDLTDTSPQPEGAASSTTFLSPESLVPFLWPQFTMADGYQAMEGGGSITSVEQWGILS